MIHNCDLFSANAKRSFPTCVVSGLQKYNIPKFTFNSSNFMLLDQNGRMNWRIIKLKSNNIILVTVFSRRFVTGSKNVKYLYLIMLKNCLKIKIIYEASERTRIMFLCP